MTAKYFGRRQQKQPIAPKQRTIIKMAQGQLGIDDATYRDMLEERFGVRSCTTLNYDQAGEFICELEGKGFVLIPNQRNQHPRTHRRTRPAARNDDRVVCLVRPDELDKINQVARLITWRVENGLQLFLAKRLKIKDGKVRTESDAYLAIEGLKKLFENGMKKAHGPAWWTMQFADPAVMEYIALHKPAEWR